MKNRDVFLVWLLADIFTVLIGSIVLFYQGNMNGHLVFIAQVILTGLITSIPSLIALLIVHAIFVSNNQHQHKYKWRYIILIVSINVAYFIVGSLNIHEFDSSYLTLISITTISGLLAFFIISKKVDKRIEDVAE